MKATTKYVQVNIDNSILLGCDAVLLCVCFARFQRNIMPSKFLNLSIIASTFLTATSVCSTVTGKENYRILGNEWVLAHAEDVNTSGL